MQTSHVIGCFLFSGKILRRFARKQSRKVRGASRIAAALLVFASAASLEASPAVNPVNNPLNKGHGPACADSHLFAHDGRLYLFAGQDPDGKMTQWQCWSTADLVNWKQESILKPESTLIGGPSDHCWAGFGVERKGKWYWYLSLGVDQIGVVTAGSPAGPWRDPIGGLLVAKGQYPTGSRDPDVLIDDDGKAYVVFGAFKYFLGELNDDMISLKQPAAPLVVENAEGPYGKGKTDDKPSLHKRDGLYYLSWSGFYAVSRNVRGPYEFRGCVFDLNYIAPDFQGHGRTPLGRGHGQTIFNDRHGNFCEFNNQWYYICNDRSQPGRKGRESVMTYVHYRDNGDIAPVVIDALGVGQYDAARPCIEAENYFKVVKARKRECPAGGFEMRGLAAGSELYFPNIHNVPAKAVIAFLASNGSQTEAVIEVREGGPDGALLGTARIPPTGGWGRDKYRSATAPLNTDGGTHGLCFVFKGADSESCRLDCFSLAPAAGPRG